MKKSIFLILLFSAAVLAQSSGGQFEITKSVISSGGGRGTGGNFSLEGTIGQSAPGKITGTGFELGSGFWGGGAASGTISRTLFDFDGDGRSDLAVRRPSNGLWYILRGTAGYTVMEFGCCDGPRDARRL
jgi:hypothetical protein